MINVFVLPEYRDLILYQNILIDESMLVTKIDSKQQINEFEPALVKDFCDDSGYKAFLNLKEALNLKVNDKLAKICLVCDKILSPKFVDCSKCNSSADLNCLKASIKKIVKQSGVWYCSEECMKN